MRRLKEEERDVCRLDTWVGEQDERMMSDCPTVAAPVPSLGVDSVSLIGKHTGRCPCSARVDIRKEEISMCNSVDQDQEDID